MARGTCRPVKACQKIRTHLQVKRGEPPTPNSQVKRIPYKLKILWGCRFSGLPAARARGEQDVLTWGPPVKVNFELATPNSVHGCTLARPTWRRMIYWAGGHCARAVHAQVVCTLLNTYAPTDQTVGTTDTILAGHMHTVPT